MTSDALSRIAAKAAGPVALIGAVGGFISDVLAPLGDFAPAVTGFSFIAAIIFAALTVRESRNNRHDIWDTAYSGGLFVSIASMLVFAVWSVILAQAPERGYLAANIDPIAQLQGQLLGIEEDIADIKETTEEIQQTTGDTAADVEAMATAQAQGFADIQAAFANLQQNQTIIENPTTPQEYYSNARLYQLKGNTAEAINAYEGYMTFNLDYIDPVQDYTDLLKATEGIARARELVNERLAAQPDSLVMEYVAIAMLESPDERMARYGALLERAPEFAPAYMGLAQAIEGKLGQGGGFRILTEQLNETYQKLREAENSQNFTRYFIDKNRAIALYDAAMQRFEARGGGEGNNPLLAQPDIMLIPGQQGWTFVFIVTDIMRELRAGFDDPTNLRSTGTLQTTAGEFANTTLKEQPVEVGEHILYFQYVDGNGSESEVYEYPFVVHPIAAAVTVQPADFTTGKSSALVQAYAYQRPDTDPYTFYWGLSESDVSNTTDVSGIGFTVFTIPDLDPGDYTLYLRAEGPDGETLGPNPFPFTVQ